MSYSFTFLYCSNSNFKCGKLLLVNISINLESSVPDIFSPACKRMDISTVKKLIWHKSDSKKYFHLLHTSQWHPFPLVLGKWCLFLLFHTKNYWKEHQLESEFNKTIIKRYRQTIIYILIVVNLSGIFY